MPIPYATASAALYHPELDPPLDPALFAGNADALCAQLSRLAYWDFERDPAPLNAVLAALGLGPLASFTDRSVGTQAFATRNAAGDTWLVFRGTQPDEIQDILHDGDALPVAWCGEGRVHRGFAEAWAGDVQDNGVRQQVIDWLDANPPAQLTVTGHSLGAALATLCAAEHVAARLVTFGSPRVGDAGFAALFAERPVRRYVDCCDLVTTLPPPLSYEHCGALCYIDRDGTLLAVAPDEPTIAADRAVATLDYLPLAIRWRNVRLRALADHAPLNYISGVLGLRAR